MTCHEDPNGTRRISGVWDTYWNTMRPNLWCTTSGTPVDSRLVPLLDALWAMRHEQGAASKLRDVEDMSERYFELLEIVDAYLHKWVGVGMESEIEVDSYELRKILSSLVAAGLWHERNGRFYRGPAPKPPKPRTVTLGRCTAAEQPDGSWTVDGVAKHGGLLCRALGRIAELEARPEADSPAAHQEAAE